MSVDRLVRRAYAIYFCINTILSPSASAVRYVLSPGEEDVHAAPAIEDPTGGTAELEAELLHTPGPTGLPTHAAEGAHSKFALNSPEHRRGN